jgi:protein-S-isoprenylcysteine O-methyltransferase Ste14
MALGIAFAGIIIFIQKDFILSKNPVTIFIQLCSIALMIWARITFGARSFHAGANTTEGKLVTNGPYRWLRHPIYAAVIYFFGGCVISYPFLLAIIAYLLIIGGLVVRMILEEKALMATYADYAAYSLRTKRVIPFVI